jgi:BTB/POZ domain-containing protein 9
MLYGGLRESNENEVNLIETSAEAFKVMQLFYIKILIKVLLKYIYTGKLQLRALEFNLILEILGLVHKYGFSELETAIPEYLKVI